MQTVTQNNVPETILSQLGGNKFKVMTGAFNIMRDGDALVLRFKGSKNANHLRVELNGLDLYKMTFTQIRGYNFKTVAEHEGAYFDQLQQIFTSETGLCTSL